MTQNTAPRAHESFIAYPINRVAGTIANGDAAEATIKALLQTGIDPDDIDVLHGEAGLHRLDPSGAEHGLLARFQRAFIHLAAVNEESRALDQHVADVRAGRFVIMVLAEARETKENVRAILAAHGASDIGFYGRWTLQWLEGQGGASSLAAGDPLIRQTYEANFNGAITRLHVESDYSVRVTPPTRSESHPIFATAIPIRPRVFMTSWQEPGQSTVVQVNDLENGIAYANIIGTDGVLHQISGTLRRLD